MRPRFPDTELERLRHELQALRGEASGLQEQLRERESRLQAALNDAAEAAMQREDAEVRAADAQQQLRAARRIAADAAADGNATRAAAHEGASAARRERCELQDALQEAQAREEDAVRCVRRAWAAGRAWACCMGCGAQHASQQWAGVRRNSQQSAHAQAHTGRGTHCDMGPPFPWK